MAVALISDLYSTSDDYFSQRSSKFNQLSMKFDYEVTTSLKQLKHALKYGQSYQDFSLDSILFQQNNEVVESKEHCSWVEEQTIKNEHKSGISLTHFTLIVSNSIWSITEVRLVQESLELCPNLDYLNLDISNLEIKIDMEVFSEQLIKISQLKTLILILVRCMLNEEDIQKLVKNISKLKNLLKFNLNISCNSIMHLDEFYEQFSHHNKLNSLAITGPQKATMSNKRQFAASYDFRKINRLVCKKINFEQERVQYIDPFADMFDFY